MMLCGILFLSAFSFNSATAQVQVNVNIGSQPQWGPVGYDYVDYYYLPDIETYYHVPKRKFVHLNPAGKWVYSNGLPHAYSGYNLYSGYKVVINQPQPYLHHSTYKVKYAGYKGNKSQVVIKNNKGQKYQKAKSHSSSGKHKQGKGHH